MRHSPLDVILDRIKNADYTDADINHIRNDFVDAIDALRTEVAHALNNHVTNYHASEA